MPVTAYTAPLPHVSWLSDLNCEPLSTSPPCGKSRDLPQISTLVIHETKNTNASANCGAARCQRSHHEPLLSSNILTSESLPFQPSLRSLQKISFSRRPNCLTWTINWKCQAERTLSAAGSWDEGGLAVCRSWISLGNSYF